MGWGQWCHGAVPLLLCLRARGRVLQAAVGTRAAPSTGMLLHVPVMGVLLHLPIAEVLLHIPILGLVPRVPIVGMLLHPQ